MIEGILECKNPVCITKHQKIDNIKFYLVNEKTKEYRCEYCDTKHRSKLIIKNARIIDKDNDFIGNVIIIGGIIQKILNKGTDIADISSYEILDAKGLAMMPAMVDLHCHFREPGYEYKEDIISGIKAAVKGGYCYVAAMANTAPVIDNAELIMKNNIKAQQAALCMYNQISAIGVNLKDEVLVDTKNISGLTKLFSNDGKSILSAEFMEKALIASKKTTSFWLHTAMTRQNL
jgi:dihydroorotase